MLRYYYKGIPLRYIYNFDNNLTNLVAVKSAVKANISMEAYQFYLHQAPSLEGNNRKDSVCNMFPEGLFLLGRFRVEH